MADLAVYVSVGAESGAYVLVPESPLPETSAFARRRLTVSKDSECVSFYFFQQFSTARTEIYALEYDVRPYQPDAEGV